MKDTIVRTAKQTEVAQSLVCKVEWCENLSPKGPFCPPCYERWQDPELPDGQTRCNGKNCDELVSKRPDGRSALCDKCDSLRLIVGANRALEDYDDPPQAPADKLDEAERHWAKGEYQKARGAARRFFTVLAEHQVEEALGTFIEDDNLGTESRQLLDEMLSLYQRDEYFEAKKVLGVFNDVQPLESDLNKIDREALSPYAQKAFDEARVAFDAHDLTRARESIELMESIDSRTAELEEAKERSRGRNSGSDRKSRKLRRRDHDSSWRQRMGVGDEEDTTTVA